MTRAEALALIERAGGEIPLTAQTALLGLNRSSLFYEPVPPSSHELLLTRRIEELFTAQSVYGVRRITAQLRRDGLPVNHKAVARHMRAMGLAAIYPGPNLSKRAHAHAVYPYLLRIVTAQHPNNVCGIDIALWASQQNAAALIIDRCIAS